MDLPMSRRQFAVRCTTNTGAAPVEPTIRTTELLTAELVAGGLEEVVVVPDAGGQGLTIRGLAPGASKDAVRELVEGQIYDATLDLIILEPGIWVDEGIRRPS
jgi:hypothetical protein